MKSKENNIFSTVLTMLTVLFAITVIAKLFIDWKKSSENEVISDEGKDILNNPEKRESLQKAIQQYREKGNWDGLKELNT